MHKAMEITTFKLMKGYSCEEFIEANGEVDSWLRRQPGFKSRHLGQEDDGTISDVLFWDSSELAERAMHRLLEELADSLVHIMIDQKTVVWKVMPVEHTMVLESSR